MEPLTDNKACLPKSNDKLIFNVAIHVDIRSDYENYWKKFESILESLFSIVEMFRL